jgi:hypothetical protein
MWKALGDKEKSKYEVRGLRFVGVKGLQARGQSLCHSPHAFSCRLAPSPLTHTRLPSPLNPQDLAKKDKERYEKEMAKYKK